MGVIRVEIDVWNPARPDASRRVRAIVDTGATLTKIPGAVLHELGILPREVRRFLLADGRRVNRRVGMAAVRIAGHDVACAVSFGRATEEPLIGATLLEQAGLAADPVKRRLVPVDFPMYLAAAVPFRSRSSGQGDGSGGGPGLPGGCTWRSWLPRSGPAPAVGRPGYQAETSVPLPIAGEPSRRP
jgi:clan AA aspartic protease